MTTLRVFQSQQPRLSTTVAALCCVPLLLLLVAVVPSSLASDVPLTLTPAIANADPLELHRESPSDDVRILPTASIHNHNRNLGATGVRTVLVLRVTSNSIGSPSISKDELYSSFFSASNSLKHQMYRCSAGLLSFEPTNYGVMDIYVDGVSSGTSRQDVVRVAEQAAKGYVGNPADIRDVANHVVFVLPDRGDGFVGNAEICPNGQAGISSFGDRHAGSLSVISHELGHNLNLNHASWNGQEYGDVTAFMGQSSAEVGGPVSCYNACNHWSLNWFPSQRMEITPGNPVTIQLAAFVDATRSGGATVLVKARDFYMQYNRAKDFNMGTRAMGNQLVVVHGDGLNGGSDTTLVAGLDMSNPTYNDGSTTIQVCSAGTTAAGVDVITISIGQGWTDCGASGAVAAAVPAPAPPTNTGGSIWWGNANIDSNTEPEQLPTTSGSGGGSWDTWWKL